MSAELTNNFFKLLYNLRNDDMVSFTEKHAKLYAEAHSSGDYKDVTAHYYSVMAKIISKYFSGSFHFAPPLEIGGKISSKKKPASLQDSLVALHLRIGEYLELGEGKFCVDIGCGIGNVMEHLANTGAVLTGFTVSESEVKIGNDRFENLGLNKHCRIREADCSPSIPLPDQCQDAAYAIYALKYFPKLDKILGEIGRIIKPGGLFVVYDLLTTDKFDEQNPKHRELLDGFKFACGMPKLHTRQSMLECSSSAGLELIKSVDLCQETGFPYYHCFTNSPFFIWLIRSRIVSHMIKLAEALKLLPTGFHRFNKIFLAGTIDKIVTAGQLGILSGAEILLFRKNF